MEQIIKTNPNVVAASNENGILIYTVGSWTVAIDKNDAIRYVDEAEQLNSVDSSGFIRQLDNEDIILSHNEAKITLDKNAANAIIDLINTSKKEIWLQ